ncbi:MAG: HAD family phosphatase [Bacteroidetes bacterium]|nr:HAD family phosphatase [Bacteroidota bacterium]
MSSTYKLIFIDIDGTLLTSDHKISKDTLSAIQRVNQINKIPVILISARPPQGLKKIYDELNLNAPVVCYNGALILDQFVETTSSVLQTSSIHPSLLKGIWTTAVGENISVSLYDMDKWISDRHSEWTRQEEEITGTKTNVTDIHILINRFAQENSGPNKILLMGEPGKIDSIERTLKASYQSLLNIYKSKPTYLEIMNIAASKKSAMKFLLDKYNLRNDAVIAIGDNYNDIEMLQFAGLGIAMGNAPSEVKDIADFVTLDNNSDGIKYALEKFLV